MHYTHTYIHIWHKLTITTYIHIQYSMFICVFITIENGVRATKACHPSLIDFMIKTKNFNTANRLMNNIRGISSLQLLFML